MMIVLVFIFGAIIGSFLNVILLRKNTEEGILFQRSRCFSCGRNLEVRDLAPILSFLWQKGGCRHCGSRISWQYPIVEVLTGLLAALVYFRVFGMGSLSISAPTLFNILMEGAEQMIRYLFLLSAFSTLFLIAVYDFKNKIIDTHFLYAFGFFAAVEFLGRGNYTDDLASSFCIALLFYFLWRFSSGRWMGRGDSNLAFAASAFLGWPQNILMLLISFWLGGVIGLSLLIFGSRQFSLKSEIPFGPFLASAVFFAWYFADFFGGFYGIILQ